jgi:undecaprenyl-diphosphatase
MNFLQSLILGVVEGLTEFLPVSSTAHLMFASALLGLAQNDFVKNFEIIIQLGAILAVVVWYWREFFDWEKLKKIIVAFIPTGIIGLALYSFVKHNLLGNITVALWTLGIGGVVLIIFEWYYGRRDVDEEEHALSYTQAFWVGVAQSIAIIPGVSRSGATIVGGRLLGLNRTTIVQFSFLLAVPTMAAATGLDLLESYKTFTSADATTLLVGFVVSFLVALLVIKWFLAYVRKHSFAVFGWYRIVAALIFAFLLIK